MHNNFIIIFGLIFLPFILTNANANTLYVKGLWANMMESPDAKSTKIFQVPRSSAVEVSKEIDVWSEITFQGKKGYVPTLALTPTIPQAVTSVLNSSDIDISTKSRKRASQFTSAAAARGLKESTYDFSKSQYEADFKALAKMESFRVKQQKGWAFINYQEK